MYLRQTIHALGNLGLEHAFFPAVSISVSQLTSAPFAKVAFVIRGTGGGGGVGVGSSPPLLHEEKLIKKETNPILKKSISFI